MNHMIKSVRVWTFAIALSLAMVISIFAGTGMEVRAEGEFSYEVVSLNADNYYDVIRSLDRFTAEEGDRIKGWLNTLGADSNTVFIACVSDGNAGVIYAWAGGDWLKFQDPGETDKRLSVTGISDIESYGKKCIVKRTSASSTSGSESKESHTHSYSWETVQEATVGQDGLEEYRCSCGDVQGRNVIPASVAAVSGLYDAIHTALQNGTASFDSGRLYTLSDYMVKKLAERTDITTVITFEYQNQKYKMTIPAGADYTKLLADSDYFYGYFYFANVIGATIEAL